MAGLLAALVQAGEKPLKALRVCEVLKDLKAYHGKTVAVVGRYSASDEGRWLGEETCARKLATGDFVWPNLLWLECCRTPAPMPPSPFVLDGAVLRRKLALIKRGTKLRVYKGPGATDWSDTWAVVYGRLETHERLEVAITPSGKMGYGFGHLSAAPAQLIYEAGLGIKFLPEK